MNVRATRAPAIVVLAVLAAACRSRSGEPAARAAATAAPAPAAPAPVSTEPAPAPSAYDRLAGRWVREDGGYVLEVRSVAADGRADAAYFNPNPIHVAKAEAFTEGGAATLFVELRAPNYPGSTYRLVYDPATDTLTGKYFQALQGQTFDVSFVRR